MYLAVNLLSTLNKTNFCCSEKTHIDCINQSAICNTEEESSTSSYKIAE